MPVQVGVGIGSDAGKVYRDYNVSVKASEDLSYLAKHKIGGDSQKWGLASLTEMLVCKEVSILVCWIKLYGNSQKSSPESVK